MKNVFYVIVALLLVTACDSSRVYEMNHEFADRNWIADSSQVFSFNITDTVRNYNIYYNLRNSVSYPFRNIYIKYELADSAGKVLQTNLLNGQLFEAKSGKPLGSGLGDVFDHQFSIVNDYSFPGAGPYSLKLSQYMRRDTLPEIFAVGVRVERSVK